MKWQVTNMVTVGWTFSHTTEVKNTLLWLRCVKASAPAVLHAQTDTGSIAGCHWRNTVVARHLLTVLLGLLSRDIGHAEDTGLDVETLCHLWAGVLHGHYGYLTHLIGATCNLERDEEMYAD